MPTFRPPRQVATTETILARPAAPPDRTKSTEQAACAREMGPAAETVPTCAPASKTPLPERETLRCNRSSLGRREPLSIQCPERLELCTAASSISLFSCRFSSRCLFASSRLRGEQINQRPQGSESSTSPMRGKRDARRVATKASAAAATARAAVTVNGRCGPSSYSAPPTYGPIVLPMPVKTL